MTIRQHFFELFPKTQEVVVSSELRASNLQNLAGPHDQALEFKFDEVPIQEQDRVDRERQEELVGWFLQECSRCIEVAAHIQLPKVRAFFESESDRIFSGFK